MSKETPPFTNQNCPHLLSPRKSRHKGALGANYRSPLKSTTFLPTSSLFPSASSSPQKQPLACHNAIKRRRGNSVRRTLFGKEDPAETSIWLEGKAIGLKPYLELSNKIMNENISKWGFDFRNDKPLENSEFEYEAINIKDVPEFYHPAECINSNVASPTKAANQLSPRKTLRHGTRHSNAIYKTTNITEKITIEPNLGILSKKSICKSPVKSPVKNPRLLSPSKIRKSNSSPATHKTPKKNFTSNK